MTLSPPCLRPFRIRHTSQALLSFAQAKASSGRGFKRDYVFANADSRYVRLDVPGYEPVLITAQRTRHTLPLASS